MKDHSFEGPDVAAAVEAASLRLGLPAASLRYVVLQRETPTRLGIQGSPARIAVLLDAPRTAPARPPVARVEEAPAPAPLRPTSESPSAAATALVEAWGEASGLDVTARVEERDGAHVVTLEGRDRSRLTDGVLDGLAHLLQKALEGPERRPVVVECGGRRLGRDEARQQEAREIAETVRRDGRSREIGPLNAYERRLVHMAVREVAGVTSYSVGEGMDRRVTVAVLPAGGGSEVM